MAEKWPSYGSAAPACRVGGNHGDHLGGRSGPSLRQMLCRPDSDSLKVLQETPTAFIMMATMAARQITAGRKCVRSRHMVDGPWAQERCFLSQRKGCLLHHDDEAREHSGKNPWHDLSSWRCPAFCHRLQSSVTSMDRFPFVRQPKPLNPKSSLMLRSLKGNTPSLCKKVM